jgi:acetyl-CoA carboxylase biotin carboxyl carrier protein
MTLDEIRELIKIVTETGVAELEVQRGNNRVRILRALVPKAQEFVAPAPPALESSLPAPANNPAPTLAPAAAAAATALSPEAVIDPTLVVVRSPIVGTFYEAASPDAAPFVRVGDTVQPGQVLCIIESMKLMNEIEAEMEGVIVAKLVTNAQPIEYGEGLFTVRPL